MQNLTKTQAAERAGVSTRTLDRLREAGDGPHFIRIGRRLLYQETDLKTWLDSKRQGPLRKVTQPGVGK